MFRRFAAKIAQKIPRFPRWGLRGIALFSAVFVVMLSCVTASAETLTYSFVCSRPQINSNSCYVEVVTTSGTPFVLYVVARDTRVGQSFDGYFTTQIDGQYLYVCAYGGSEVETYGYCYFQNGSSGLLTNASVYRTGIYLGNYGSVKSIQGYNCSTGDIGDRTPFTFVYGSDNTINDRMSEIISILQNSQSSTETAVDNANKKAEEREKNETQAAGDKSTSDTESALPSVNEGFGTSLKSFVQSMSYNGTEALLPIPRLYIPAMSNVTDEITLMNEQNYDMSAAINQYLPDTLLQLIRHLFTIALILYCVYELYGLIQYVLTLRKGGKEE